MTIELAAEPRTDLGKEKCRKLRAANRLPGNLYGGVLDEARAISLDLHETEKLVKAHGRQADYTMQLEGQKYPVQIQEIRYEPIHKRFLHVDFVVRADE